MKLILLSILVVIPSVASADKTFNAGSGAKWDCKKDSTVTINHGDGTYTFKGKCKTINVNGGGGKFTVESVDEINLAGAEITATIGTVGTINVSGNENKVTWKTAKTGDAPAINNTGTDNVISQAGGAKPAQPAAAPAAAKPASGTAIDCAKTPTFEYAENDGTFTLTGKCKQIMISGNKNKLTVESVESVMLSGNENTIAAASAKSVATTGNSNVITYKGTKPKLVNTGNGNKISAAK